jgi:uncharacterized protein
MRRGPGRLLLLSGIALLLLILIGRAGSQYYIDALWYEALGQSRVFWTRFGLIVLVRLLAGILAGVIVLANLWAVARQVGPVHVRRRYGNLEIAEQIPRRLLVGGAFLVAALAGWWLSTLAFGQGDALRLAAWWQAVPWNAQDPLFGRDLGFYLFTLPVLEGVLAFAALVLAWSVLLVVLGYSLVGAIRWRQQRIELDPVPRRHLGLLAGAAFLLIALRFWLGRYGLLIEGTGFGGAFGYTDHYARLPGRAILTLVSVAVAGIVVWGTWRRRWVAVAGSVAALLVVVVLLGGAYPAVVQRFTVQPNELARETRFIAWNMEFTRRAYRLDEMVREPFRYRPTPPLPWEAVQPRVARLGLWDPEPLRTALNELQSIFGYYYFPDVDMGRYGPLGQEEQVAIAVREFQLRGLQETARTWQSLRLNPRYIGGAGAVVVPSARPSQDGEPVRWLANLEPITRHPGAPPGVDLQDVRVFFGEGTGRQEGPEYVIWDPARDTVQRPHAPRGILLNSFLRLSAAAIRFGDVNLLFSREIRPESRLLFQRGIMERVNELAPFVLWDPDPYPVLFDGRIVWVVEGYAAAGTFPLARPIEIRRGLQVNYLRNSLKAVVDAVTGEVLLYVVEPGEPLVETYRRIFPTLFRDLADMPAGLRRHLRYAPRLLQMQADVLREYHLESPAAFYASQDVWAIPPGIGATAAYRPTFIVTSLPGREQLEFLLFMPFIAKERQNMTAVLVGRSDGEALGELVLLELPRDQQIPGPGQVQALIEQDPVIASQLSLWRQAGSDVQLGHLRVVPVDTTFLYAEPLFLSAAGRAIPELRRVIVSDGRSVFMAPTLEEAVRGLAGGGTPGPRPPEVPQPLPREAPRPLAQLPDRALQLFEEAERLLRQGDWAGFGARWAELHAMLRAAAQENR